MTRIAAVGDVHVGTDSAGQVAPGFAHLPENADALLLAGDLTRWGTREEAEVLLGELAGVDVPVIAVLGNHDFQSDAVEELVAVLEDGGVRVLDGTTATVEVAGVSVGVAGAKGFGSGFAGAGATAFGEPVMKAFVEEATREADRLQVALGELTTDYRVALMHYSPVPDTLAGERLEIYPFLGSHLLAEAVDSAGADLVLHGHAHHGSERGVTPGGIRVRNVAQPVIGHAYRAYEFAPPPSRRGRPGTRVVSAMAPGA